MTSFAKVARHWADLVRAHHQVVRGCLARYRGRELDTAGDGFFAAFDGPARGIRCAQAIVSSVGELGLEVRAGLHVLLRRIASRTTNGYGKSVDERERIVSDITDVEPLLRATCTHEIDATQSVAAVVAELAAIGENATSGRQPATP